jgi:uncharacterized protein YqeY
MTYLGKDSVSFGILGLVISEIQRTTLSEDVPDDKVVKVLKKLIESINDSLAKAKEHGAAEDKVLKLTKELEVLSSYLPEEPILLSEQELTDILISVLAEHPEWKTNMGGVFGYMKSNYANLYDGKLVKEILAKL